MLLMLKIENIVFDIDFDSNECFNEFEILHGEQTSTVSCSNIKFFFASLEIIYHIFICM